MFYSARAFKVYEAFLTERPAVSVPAEYVEITGKIIEKIGWHTDVRAMPESNVLNAANISVSPRPKDILLALSGGLDSTYFLYNLKDSGYNVTAVHITGLNKSTAGTEAERARRIAQEAGVQFISVEFKAPKQAFPDNPFKNQLVLAIMLDLGAERGITKYAVGSDWTTPLSEAAVGYTITDSVEVNREYWRGVQKYFPEAELLFIDNADKKYQRLQYLYKFHFTALNKVSSCICPTRFRKFRHGQNIAKYGVPLMDGRCGSCYKCSMEYILLVEAGLVPKNKAYFQHCWDILATSKTAHRPDLFSKALPYEVRLANLMNYGS